MQTYAFPKEEFLTDLRGLMQINSIGYACGAVTEEAPLGQGTLDALQYMLDLGKKAGFRVSNLDGYCGWMEIGSGDEMVAILVHVDTVGISDNWKYPPIDLTVEGDLAYGRGVSDDKGPAMAAFYAMKALSQSGKPLKRRVRLVVGCDEEFGDWKCMKRYCKTEELPTMAFTPDSSFPVTYAEKGILHLLFKLADPAACPSLRLLCENAYNVVPVSASATWQDSEYAAEGVPAHAMEPSKGVNAILKLCDTLRAKGCDHPFVKLAERATDKGLGIDFTDEYSGSLTINPAIAAVDAAQAVLRCDCRVPVSFTAEDVRSAAQKAVEDLGFVVETEFFKPPLHVSTESELVQTLTAVYREMTGDETPPQSSGGGTYARAFDNAVAFGAIFPSDPETYHQDNECWPVSSMELATKIMLEALTRLST